MNEKMADRPTSLRRKPQPSADEKVDPIDFGTPAAAQDTVELEHPIPSKNTVKPNSINVKRNITGNSSSDSTVQDLSPEIRPAYVPATTVATGRPGRPRNREITMNFSSQLAVDVHEIIDAVVASEGLTRRAVVELAVRNTWGTKATSQN